MSEFAVRISGSAEYFHGFDEDARPVFGKFNSGMKIYRDKPRRTAEQCAQAAIRLIADKGCDMAKYLETVEVAAPVPLEIPPDELPKLPDIPNGIPEKAEEIPPLVPLPNIESGGWKAIDSISGKAPALCRRLLGDSTEFALYMPDGKYYGLPADELLAWERWCDERKKFIITHIRERREKEKPPPVVEPDGETS